MALDRKTITFLLVAAAIFTDMMAYSLVIPVLPSYAMSLGADRLTIGVIFGAFSVALLACSIPAGLLSDRTGRRPIMVLGMLTLAVASVAFASSANVSVLVAARLVQGASGAATWSAGLALLADMYGPGERGEKLGLALSVMSIGMLLGPVFGGVVYDHLGYAPTFVLPAAIACAIGLAFGVCRLEPAGAPMGEGTAPHKGSAASNNGGAGYLGPVFAAPAAFLACGVVIVVGAATFGLIEPYMPVYLYQAFAASPTAIGLAFGGMALLSAATQPLAGRLYDRHGGRAIIAAGLLASSAVIAASVLAPTLPLTAGALALLGIPISCVLSPTLPLLGDLYGGRGGGSRGFAYGAYNTLFSAGLALGPFAGGLLVARLSLPATLLGHAALLAAVGVLGYFFLATTRREEPLVPAAKM